MSRFEEMRQIDALVAEHIIGYSWLTFLNNSYLVPNSIIDDFHTVVGWQRGKLSEPDLEWSHMPSYGHLTIPRYSSSWDAAACVIQHMRDGTVAHMHGRNKWSWYARGESIGWPFVVSFGYTTRGAETFPMAVCLAALSALGVWGNP